MSSGLEQGGQALRPSPMAIAEYTGFAWLVLPS